MLKMNKNRKIGILDLCLAVKAAGQQRREAHRPRQRVELLPEPVDHARHVERQHEPDRYHVAPTVAVVGDELERPVRPSADL